MTNKVVVFGAVVVAFAFLLACALERPTLRGRLKTFAWTVLFVMTLAGAGAMRGIIYREALKALP